MRLTACHYGGQRAFFICSAYCNGHYCGNKPIASGAKPAGALPCVEPMMTNRNSIVITISISSAEVRS